MIRIFGKYDSQSDLNREIKNYLESSNFNWQKDFILERVRDKFLNSDYIFVSKVAPTKSVAAETGFFTVKILGYNISARNLSFHMCGEPDGPFNTGFSSDVEECICYGKAPLSFIYLWNNSELRE